MARTWTAETWLAGVPDEVLARLTEPESIASWSPVPYEVLELDGGRLETGSRARVRGALGGRLVEFTVDIQQAHNGRLALLASGPVFISAEYLLRAVRGGTSLRASVSVTGRGSLGALVARGVECMLAAGLLRASVSRLASQCAHRARSTEAVARSLPRR
jgi:Polyketide cyclase / dehydrase and lipid transport